MLAWGARVSSEFRRRVIGIASLLQLDPSWLMACMAFETGRTFDPAIRNAAGSGATGLIQFMPSTARRLGTTTDALAAMTAEEQLAWVELYFREFAGRLHSLDDTYMAILWPRAVGQPADYAIATSAEGNTYLQNRGLDVDADGRITKAEAAAKVQRLLDEGLQPGNVYDYGEQPADPIEDRSTNVDRKEETMPTPMIAANLLTAILPQVMTLFSGRLQDKVAKVTGASPEAAGQVLNAIVGQIGGAVGIPVTNESTALAAVSAVANAPAGQKEALVAQLEPQIAASLEALAPFLERIVKLQVALREASDASHDRAAARLNTPEGWKLRWTQATFTQRALAYGAAIVAALTIGMVIACIWLPPDVRTVVVNLAGQLIAVEILLITGLVNTFRDQNGFSFGGTVDSNAAAMANDEMKARREPRGG